MTTIRLLIICFLTILFSCNSKEEDKTLKIYHLRPNDIQTNSDTLRSYGWYSKIRNDFFAMKNFDATNEQHKIKVDSFVVNYIKKDNFLIKNKNSKWVLTFFRYGDDINENTEHQYNTDYTIHNLFATNKIEAYFFFDSKMGYRSSTYSTLNNGKVIDERKKRKIISNYFKIKATNNGYK